MDFKYDIAMLLATRGRTESLGRSIRSLVDQAENIERVQLMFAFDRDDDVGTTYFATDLQPWLDARNVAYTAMKFDRMGSIGLHKYNDGQFKLLSYRTHNLHPYSIFPIVPRKWYDLLGYISPHPTQDGWVSQQAYMLDIYERIAVDVLHDRYDLTGNNNDETFQNRPMLEGKPDDPRDFHSKKMLELRHRDSAKLATYMRSIGMSTVFFENVFKGTQDPWEKLAKNDVNKLMVQFANPHSK